MRHSEHFVLCLTSSYKSERNYPIAWLGVISGVKRHSSVIPYDKGTYLDFLILVLFSFFSLVPKLGKRVSIEASKDTASGKGLYSIVLPRKLQHACQSMKLTRMDERVFKPKNENKKEKRYGRTNYVMLIPEALKEAKNLRGLRYTSRT